MKDPFVYSQQELLELAQLKADRDAKWDAYSRADDKTPEDREELRHAWQKANIAVLHFEIYGGGGRG